MCLSTHLPQAGGHDHAAGHQAHVNLHLPPLVPAVPQRPQRESVYLQILYNCKLPVLERSSPKQTVKFLLTLNENVCTQISGRLAALAYEQLLDLSDQE